MNKEPDPVEVEQKQIQEFVASIRAIINEPVYSLKTFKHGIKLLDDNGWQSSRTVPEDKREWFLNELKTFKENEG